MSNVEKTLCLQCKLSLPYSERSRQSSHFTLLNGECQLSFKKSNAHYEIWIHTGSKDLFEDSVVRATTYIQNPRKNEQLLGGQEVTLSGNQCKLWTDTVNKFMQTFPLYSETEELKIVVILSGLPVTTSSPSSDGEASSEFLNLRDREADGVQQLIDALPNLLEDTKWADAQIHCRHGKTLLAHSWMLALRSPYFDENLKRNKDGCTIKLEVDVDEPTMRHVVRYIYLSEMPPALDAELACALFVAGERFSLHGLKRKCWAWMSEKVNEENFIVCLKAAHKTKCHILMNAVIAFMCNHREVLEGDHWKNFITPSNLAVEVLQRIVTTPVRQRTPS